MDAIFELIGAVISILLRTAIVLVATPFVFLWPRQDKTLSYWQAVWVRYKRVFGWALT